MFTALVVEDSLDILSALSEALSEEGWAVVGADSAEAAIFAVKDRKIDVVLCDVLLPPGIDGLALRDQFAARGLGHLPFVFMTAAVRVPGGLDGHAVLRKPFAIPEVLASLKAAIARHVRRPASWLPMP